MTRDLGPAPLTRCLLVWMAVTGGATALGLALVPDVLGTLRRPDPFDRLRRIGADAIFGEGHGKIEEIREPIVRASVMCPTEYIGAVMKLNEDKRGKYVKQEHIGMNRVMLTYEIPLAEIILDFYDRLKTLSRGYATLDYELAGYRANDLVRLDMLVAGKRVDALSVICDRADAERRGRAIVKKLRSEIDRHMFEVAIQAAIGNRIVARESVRPLAKNVTGKCYGGDITRKRKLWDRQREGKRRMKQFGNVEIPQEAFLAVLKI